MSSINQENSPAYNRENISTVKHKSPLIAADNSDNGFFDKSSVDNQSVRSSSVSNRSANENDRSGVLLSIDNTISRLWNNKMILFYGREFFCILMLLLGTYATFQNMPPKVSKIAASKPFFPKGSLVTDWPNGQLATAQSKVALSDLSFVLFYAPWCAESQHARESYEYVARMFYRQAHFSAINCWQPGGECRAQYSKVMAWPVLMAYLQNGLAVPYNGRWNTRELTQFIRVLMKPLKRITNPSQLLDMMASHDAVVVSFVDLLMNRSHYSNFYKTSVKWIEKDPNQEVIFGVVTGEARRNFGIEANIPVIRMYLWNDTVEYINSTWTQPVITDWISKTIHQVSAWLSPPGTKSATLAPYLKRGPTMLFFTPRIHFSESNDAYTMLRQVALEYYNCPSTNKDWIEEMSRDYMKEQRITAKEQRKLFQETCKKLVKQARLHDSAECSQTVSVTFANIVNSSAEKLPSQRIFGPKNVDESTNCLSHHYDYDDEACHAVPTFVCDSRSNERVNAKLGIPMLDVEIDEHHADSLIERELRLKCEMFSHGDEENVIFFNDKSHYDQEIDFDSISGLSCKSNRTLSFLAVDSLMYHIFAERLGVNVLKQPMKSAVLIMDYENESTYILEEPINTNSIVNFVKNFHNKTLSRHLKSESQGHLKSSAATQRYIPIKKTISLREINSDNFVEEVVSSNKTVAVLFYSNQCALCTLMSHTLMVTSKILQDIDHIDFVRIDGDRNDLPWQYTVDKFPTLLIFAENRKTESRIFPAHLQVTIQNVLGFLLANLNRPLRLHALVFICQNIHKTSPYDDCLSVLRNEITDNISYSLRQWRKLPYHRSQIYRRLQLLQRMYLHLFKITVSCDFSELVGYASDIRKVWTMV